MPLVDTINSALPTNSSLTDGPNGVATELRSAKTWLKALIATSNAQEEQLDQIIVNPSAGSLSFVLGAFRITCINYGFSISAGSPVSQFITYPVVYSVHPPFIQMTLVSTGSTASGVPKLAVGDDPTGVTGTRMIVSSAEASGVSTTIAASFLIIGLK